MSKTNTHDLLKDYHGTPEYPEIAKFAAGLAKEGEDIEVIMNSVKSVFGEGPAKLKPSAKAKPLALFGEPGVDFDYKTIDQMETAMRMPSVVGGALMPDGHVGYGVPIGGVIQTKGTVFPGWVGYDISCMMQVTVLDITPDHLMKERDALLDALVKVTSFGVGASFKASARRSHVVMNLPAWDDIPILKELKPLAYKQIGTSGGGNHFADLVIGTVTRDNVFMHFKEGEEFTALMTHSGSRGPGYKVASHYIKKAETHTRRVAVGIPKGYGWLSTRSEEGKEYIWAMQTMGAYAAANHHLIHWLFLKEAGLSRWAAYTNRHNYAWKEGQQVLHRKGATPAHKGAVGIIPGSSGSASYLVEGLGNSESLYSASHGAGRVSSRTQAKKEHDPKLFKDIMEDQDIKYVGVAPDETVFAYKDIERVIAVQEGTLVSTFAKLRPVAVVMGGKK